MINYCDEYGTLFVRKNTKYYNQCSIEKGGSVEEAVKRITTINVSKKVLLFFKQMIYKRDIFFSL